MRVILRRLFRLFILGLLGMSFACFAQNVSIPSDKTSCDLLKLDSLVGMVALSLGGDKAVAKTMPCLLTLWQENKNRGSGDFYVSNAFLSVMEENPPAFFASMVNEQKVFSEWLDDLQDLSFTWSDEPPCGADVKRKQLILLLKHTQIQEPSQLALKNSVLKKLKVIRCRQID